jgi:Spy/CpxP family protein refolding chaperone
MLSLAFLLTIGPRALAAQEHGGMAAHDMTKMAQALDLTADQQAQIKAIFAGAQTQIDQVLTPAQQKKFKALHEHADQQNMTREQFAKALHLTDSQMAQLKSIRDSFMAQAKTIKEDASLSAEEKSARTKAAQEAAHEQVKKVLTPAQMKKFDEIHERAGQEEHGMGMAQMAKTLNLSSSQQTRVKAIFADVHTKIRQVLTPEQQAKFDAMHEHADNTTK